MVFNPSIAQIANSIVPISRFNRGEAGKIFDEVSKCGYKIVVKNNKPTCVLINPELLEDYFLFNEAEKRLGREDVNFVSEADLMSSLEISEEELRDVEN